MHGCGKPWWKYPHFDQLILIWLSKFVRISRLLCVCVCVAQVNFGSVQTLQTSDRNETKEKKNQI